MSFKLHTAVAAVLLAVSADGVVAQPRDAARPDAPPTSSASAALPGGASGDRSAHLSGYGSGHGLVYRSAFDGYRAFTDQPVLSWRESNDLVGRIGGWQAYALEGHVPVREINRLLKERPVTVGLAVPAMPRGSPGMDGPEYGSQRDPFEVLPVRRDGSARVYQAYR